MALRGALRYRPQQTGMDMRAWIWALGGVVGCASADDPVLVTLQGAVSGGLEGKPVANAEITVIDADGREVVTTSDANGQWSTPAVLAGGAPLTVDLEVAAEGYVATELHHEVAYDSGAVPRLALAPGRVEDSDTLMMPSVPLAQVSDETGSLAGTVVNAMIDLDAGGSSTNTIDGIALTVRRGVGVPDGDVVAETVSGDFADGAFRVDALAAGTYTIYAEGDEAFMDAYVTVVVPGGGHVAGTTIGLVPRIDADSFRVVLTWDEIPFDLDSHLVGPLPGGAQFHVFFGAPDAPHPRTGEEYARLDVDDVTSFGPETTTVLHRANGRFSYLVHDFTNRDLGASTEMSNSGARLQVWSAGSYATFGITPDVSATVWHAFDIGRDGEILFVNDYSFQPDPSLVGIGTGQ